MLQPAKTKFRKQQKGRIRGVARTGCNLAFGDFGLQAISHGRITARQLEAGRMAMSHAAKRGGKLWIRVFPDKPICKKPAETRMGKGKGTPEEYVVPVRRGRMLFELQGIDRQTAVEALRLASHKLPLRTKIVVREEYRESK